MRTLAATCIGALAALACTVSARAHHSGSMYVTAATWIKGTVVRLEELSPHSIITLEERGADGQMHRWAIEGPPGPALGRLNLRADLPREGDAVEICAFGYKSPEALSRLFPGTDFSARRPRTGPEASLAGHVMMLPSGKMQLWEPHGLLSECIRSSDDGTQPWLDFLSSNARARQAWCEQRRYAVVQSSAALKALADEISGSIEDLCE